MNIVKNIDQYNEDHVFFCDPIKNNIMNNGNFIRIIYSTSYFVLNGIYLLVSITYTSTDKYYNKYKCTFDVNKYKDTIEKLHRIEEGILTKCNIRSKTPQYKISEQLKNGSIKIFSDTIDQNNNKFLLKIAGIWETENEYGLTYKFINL
jgi:cytochrome c biogenesis protein ResB